jgi:N-acyl-L-homoserine lactone synthetase
MLHIIHTDPDAVPDAVMRAMFVARREVFVDLLKWDLAVLDGKYELDQFDDTHARYIILTERDGRHLGSARLLPTLRPHLLDSFYPALCEEGAPRGAGIMEITRFCLDRSLSASDRRAVRDTLVVAITQHALACGIRAYSAIAELRWLQQILAFGWRCALLGTPKEVSGMMLGALRIDIEADTPARLATAGILPWMVTQGTRRRAA